MSSSSEYSEFSDQKPPSKSSEQSTFSQTCSLLSLYLKERGSFGDLTLGMKCNIEGIGSPDNTSCHSATTNTMNLLPPSLHAMNLSVSKDPKASQLTIFYGGQVHVFDEFPAEKAKEIISFASSNVISQNQNMSAYSFTQNLPSSPPNVVASSADSRTQINTKVNIITSNVANNLVLEPQNAIPLPRLPRPNIADLPIARKASLHRFLEKRKSRITANQPYQKSNNSSKPHMPWIGLSPNSPQV